MAGGGFRVSSASDLRFIFDGELTPLKRKLAEALKSIESVSAEMAKIWNQTDAEISKLDSELFAKKQTINKRILASETKLAKNLESLRLKLHKTTESIDKRQEIMAAQRIKYQSKHEAEILRLKERSLARQTRIIERSSRAQMRYYEQLEAGKIDKFGNTIRRQKVMLEDFAQYTWHWIARFGMMYAIFKIADITRGITVEIIDAARQMDQLSKITGFTTEALSGLDIAAKKYLITTEQLQRALAYQAKSLSLLGQEGGGKGRVAWAYDKLKLSFEELKDLKPEEQLKLITERFVGLETASDKSGVAIAIFERSGREMIPILEELGVDFEKYERIARKTGAYFETDFVQTTVAVGQELETLKKQLQGVGISLGKHFMEPLRQIVHFLNEIFIPALKWSAESNMEFMKALTDPRLNLIDFFKEVNHQIDILSANPLPPELIKYLRDLSDTSKTIEIADLFPWIKPEDLVVQKESVTTMAQMNTQIEMYVVMQKIRKEREAETNRAAEEAYRKAKKQIQESTENVEYATKEENLYGRELQKTINKFNSLSYVTAYQIQLREKLAKIGFPAWSGEPAKGFETREFPPWVGEKESEFNRYWMLQNEFTTDTERAMKEITDRQVEVQNQGKEAYLSSASNLLFAASSLAEAGGNTKAAAIIQRIAAIGQSIAAFNMQMAALSLAFAAKAISAATFNFLGIVAAASAIIAIIANLASFGSFAKGGFVSKGPDSLPDFSKIPQAAGGLWTGKLPPEGMLINVHSDELVTNVGQIGTIIGALAQRVFDQRPLPALSSGGVSGGTTIVINAQGSFDSPSFWKEVYRTKIKPALQEVEYGRS